MVWELACGNEPLPLAEMMQGSCVSGHTHGRCHLCALKRGMQRWAVSLGASMGCGVRVCKEGLECFDSVLLWLGEMVLLEMSAWLTLLPRCSHLAMF